MLARYLVEIFALAWGGREIYQHIKQAKQNRDCSPADRGSLFVLYG